MMDFNWTTGGDNAVTHVARIAAGGSGVVHKVFPFS